MNRIQEMKQAVFAAAETMMSASDETLATKTNAKDFVTVADIKSQNILRDELTARFVGSIVLSEEDEAETREALYAPDFTGFVIDPIDGTYNFKRGMRESAISIGYVEDGEPIAGVIFDPYKDELFEAVKGEGALMNDAPIRVSGATELRGASVATSNGYDDAAAVRNLQRHLAIHEQTGVMPWTSVPGSAVLAMAWVACGRIDAFHHNGLKPWDNAAAFLLVREAGGTIENLAGGPIKFTDAEVLMGTPLIQQQLQSAFAAVPGLLQ